MTAYKAIRIHCVDCVGGVAEDAALCQIRDCVLWPFRLGCKMSSGTYRRRVERTWERGGDRVEEVRGLGLNMADFLLQGHPGAPHRKNPARSMAGAGPAAISPR